MIAGHTSSFCCSLSEGGIIRQQAQVDGNGSFTEFLGLIACAAASSANILSGNLLGSRDTDQQPTLSGFAPQHHGGTSIIAEVGFPRAHCRSLSRQLGFASFGNQDGMELGAACGRRFGENCSHQLINGVVKRLGLPDYIPV